MNKPHCYGKMDWILKYPEDETPKEAICRCVFTNSCLRLTRSLEIDNLKREVLFHMKRAQEAEVLLREVQPYCIPEDKQKISEFFKR